MNNEDCLFCKIIKGEIPSYKVYEDGDVLAFLDAFPVNPGHTLVIPKEHYTNLAVTPSEVAANIMRVVPDLMKAIMKATGAEAVNIGVNNGEQAGQSVFHTHLHIMPRFEGDGYENWHGEQLADAEKATQLADTIRSGLST